MRYTYQRVANAPFSGMKPELLSVEPDVGHGIEIHFGEIVADAGAERASRRVEDESPSLGQPKLHTQSGAAKAGVAAKGSLGTVAVIVAHADVALP
jgi:hypothetical protein